MIIKSMSRKEPTFAQLYDYITRDGDHDSRFTFTQNFILRTREEILREFERNAALLTKRKNANYLYHEVISITRAKGISEQRQKELLQDIITQYSKSRGEDCLIFGGMHDEKDNNLHYHLMISANSLNQTKRHSLKKASFSRIKKQTELYVLERYPELEQAKLISKEIVVGTTSNKEQELKRRTGKPSQKDVFKSRLEEIFANSVDKQSFFDNLKVSKIEIYTRGKTIGFVDLESGRKHRLKTLGLEAQFEVINNTISTAEVSRRGTDSKQESGKPASTEKGQSKTEKKPRKATAPKASDTQKPISDEQRIINDRKAAIKKQREQTSKQERRRIDDSKKQK